VATQENERMIRGVTKTEDQSVAQQSDRIVGGVEQELYYETTCPVDSQWTAKLNTSEQDMRAGSKSNKRPLINHITAKETRPLLCRKTPPSEFLLYRALARLSEIKTCFDYVWLSSVYPTRPAQSQCNDSNEYCSSRAMELAHTKILAVLGGSKIALFNFPPGLVGPLPSPNSISCDYMADSDVRPHHPREWEPQRTS
jgi:hypothetical protein